MKCPYCSGGRVVSERQSQFHLRAQDTPTSSLPQTPPFQTTGFSTWSLHSSLAELERVLDNLRAYMQIIDVASILGLDYDISDHAFQLFRSPERSGDCRFGPGDSQEPRTLQEISIAANVAQKEIGKYIKILGEALQLSQPINSNSISVHMPRFCSLLQLNSSAQKLATRIYLACQLEDKRKTQAEICKVTVLTEVTLRKVYKELLENWDDLLPSNYTPAVPPERAFPTTVIASGRSSSPKVDLPELPPTLTERNSRKYDLRNHSRD